MTSVLLRLMGSGLAALLAAPAVQGADNSVAAVWRERHVDFMYAGRTTRYSCDGLRDKVRAMLLDLGARRDPRIVAIGCEGEDRLRVNSLQPSLSIAFTAPALPDSAVKLRPRMHASWPSPSAATPSATWESATASWCRNLHAKFCQDS